MEKKISAKHGAIVAEKKPKDLLRAIGRIESDDWNIREIEKKIELSKKTEVGKSREKVPKWSKEQFLQRQHKMARPQDASAAGDERFKDIDQTIRNLDKQLKDGSHLERGQRGNNKVASIASGTFGNTRTDEQTDAADKIGVQKTVCSVSYCVLFFVCFPMSHITIFLSDVAELEEKSGFQRTHRDRCLSLLQTESVPNGEDLCRRPVVASGMSQVSPLSHQPPAGWLRIRSGRPERSILLHTALPAAG